VGTGGYNQETPEQICAAQNGVYVYGGQQGKIDIDGKTQRWACCAVSNANSVCPKAGLGYACCIQDTRECPSGDIRYRWYGCTGQVCSATKINTTGGFTHLFDCPLGVNPASPENCSSVLPTPKLSIDGCDDYGSYGLLGGCHEKCTDPSKECKAADGDTVQRFCCPKPEPIIPPTTCTYMEDICPSDTKNNGDSYEYYVKLATPHCDGKCYGDSENSCDTKTYDEMYAEKCGGKATIPDNPSTSCAELGTCVAYNLCNGADVYSIPQAGTWSDCSYPAKVCCRTEKVLKTPIDTPVTSPIPGITVYPGDEGCNFSDGTSIRMEDTTSSNIQTLCKDDNLYTCSYKAFGFGASIPSGPTACSDFTHCDVAGKTCVKMDNLGVNFCINELGGTSNCSVVGGAEITGTEACTISEWKGIKTYLVHCGNAPTWECAYSAKNGSGFLYTRLAKDKETAIADAECVLHPTQHMPLPVALTTKNLNKLNGVKLTSGSICLNETTATGANCKSIPVPNYTAAEDTLSVTFDMDPTKHYQWVTGYVFDKNNHIYQDSNEINIGINNTPLLDGYTLHIDLGLPTG